MTTFNNSMTSCLKPSDIANEARMKRGPAERRRCKKLAIVIVEGSADQRFYTTILDASKCLIIQAHGKDKAINALQILLTDNTPGVMSLVDDDYDSLEGRSLRNENIAVSDTHDLETLLFAARSLDKFLITLLLDEKIDCLEEFSSRVRKKLIELGSPIGLIRWFFQRENIQINFGNMSLQAFIDICQLSINFNSCIDEILSRNKDCKITKSIIQDKLPDLQKINPDPWLVCQGHDLVKILLLILPQLLSPYLPASKDEALRHLNRFRQKFQNEAHVTEQLIMSYEQDEFRKTVMYKDIKQWERRNPPYQLARS